MRGAEEFQTWRRTATRGADVPRRACRIRAPGMRRRGSISELAALIEAQGLLQRIERGLVSPSVETLDRIANGLGAPISRFFGDQARRTDFCHVSAGRGVVIDRGGAVADYRYGAKAVAGGPVDPLLFDATALHRSEAIQTQPVLFVGGVHAARLSGGGRDDQ